MNYPKIVKKIEDFELSYNKTFCPFCKSADIENKGGRSTLVGFFGKNHSADDPNHHLMSYTCKVCKQSFTKEIRCGVVWYTQNNRVLQGLPNCFESYEFTCYYCNGVVKQHDVGGDTREAILENGDRLIIRKQPFIHGRSIKDYITMFTCESCGKSQKEIISLKEKLRNYYYLYILKHFKSKIYIKIGWKWYHTIFPSWILKLFKKQYIPWTYETIQNKGE